MIYRLTFLRHAESAGNAAGQLQGQSNIPLTERGVEQARQLAEQWLEAGVRFDRAISSPLRRARQTAETIASTLSIPLEFNELWSERNFGSLEGKPFELLRQSDPPIDFYHPYATIGETGESQVDLYQRALRAVQELLRQPAGRILVVSHGAFLGKVMSAILGITPQGHYNSPAFWMGNTAYINLAYDPETRQWRWYGFHNPDEWAGHQGE